MTGATGRLLGTRSEQAADSPATAAVPARRRILDTAHRLFAAEGIRAAGAPPHHRLTPLDEVERPAGRRMSTSYSGAPRPQRRP